jgi:hypothetical protein
MCLRVKETWTCGCENLRRAPRCQNAIAYQKVCQNVKTVCHHVHGRVHVLTVLDYLQLPTPMRYVLSSYKSGIPSIRRAMTPRAWDVRFTAFRILRISIISGWKLLDGFLKIEVTHCGSRYLNSQEGIVIHFGPGSPPPKTVPDTRPNRLPHSIHRSNPLSNPDVLVGWPVTSSQHDRLHQHRGY